VRTAALRIPTTHTGSLPRPPDLTDMLARRDRGETVAAFDERVSDAVSEMVRRQLDVGITVVNDGEASKINYASYVRERLDGFGGASEVSWVPEHGRQEFPDFWERMPQGDLARPACIGAVRSRGLAAVEVDIANLRAAVADLEVDGAFMTAASPGVIAVYLRNQHYETHEDYIWALAEAMKPEYDAIHEAGLVLQLDCPDLTSLGELVPDHGRTAMHIEAINHATRDIPPERMRLHLCWGNYQGPHNHDQPLQDLIGLVLGARPAAISFEAANPRHQHEWRVFEAVDLPDGKVLIPGVIDSTSSYIEHPRLVADRILRYALLVGPENVIAGTDCGFATTATHLAVDPAIAWAKLRAMAEGVRIASDELTGDSRAVRSPAAT
jgi:5-methyltetrahydropteroyltriglutamate--homocysteine methyltransferase